tara:strand:+ start:15774 stop:16844 length:1071 start_codon:yes stop_codon:yes gene_type:complete
MVRILKWITDGTALDIIENVNTARGAINSAIGIANVGEYDRAEGTANRIPSSAKNIVAAKDEATIIGSNNQIGEVLNSGYLQENIIEPNPKYNAGKSEKVISKGMSNIILGRDRSSDLKSGYGGQGNSHAGTIDLVTGLSGMLARQINSSGEKVLTNKNMFLDSARVYISQKTDIDKNFALTEGSVGSPNARSGIAVKADGVRIIGREGIKLVTSTDNYNSQGVNIAGEIAGIDLIAGNDTKVHPLEPLVKGDQLIRAMANFAELIRDLNSTCRGLLTNLIFLHWEYASHIHISAVGPGTPPNGGASLLKMSVNAASYALDMADTFVYDKNVKAWELNALHPFGKGYINSSFNNTN